MANTPDSAPRILVVDADPALLGLIEAWLSEQGCRVVEEGESVQDGFHLAVVDVPFPRKGGTDVIKRIAKQHPGMPVLALSSSFFARVESDGAVARALGVAGVLAKPVSRDALLAAVHRLLDAAK